MELTGLSIDAHDPHGLADFWRRFLGWDQVDARTLAPTDDTGFQLRFHPTDLPKTRQNQAHLDLTSTSLEDQQDKIARALELGGRHVDVGQRGDEGHVVLGDPEGNEFCVIEPDNKFLAECGPVGALSCDGSQQVGYFWSEALGWPLVWDQDEETAIRSAAGGPIISWGGPPFTPKTGKNRLHIDLAPAAGADLRVEVERLIALGARRVDIGQGDVGWVVLADPDGNEFCVEPPG